MKPPIVTMYAGLTTLVISAVYFVFALQFWPKAPPTMVIPIIIAGAYTQRRLSLYFIDRQIKRAREHIASQPYAYMRLDLEALCRTLVSGSDAYTTTSVNGEVTIDVERWELKPYDDSWDISITLRTPHGAAPDGDSLYQYDVQTYHLTPDSPEVMHGHTVVIKTRDQTREEGETILAEDVNLAYMDECIHALLKQAFMRAGCTVETKLR